jgi:hypothetical protein
VKPQATASRRFGLWPMGVWRNFPARISYLRLKTGVYYVRRIMLRTRSKAQLFLFFSIFSLCLFGNPLAAAAPSEEFTRSASGNVSGEIKKLQLYTPGNLGGAVTIQTGENRVCLVDMQCWARAKNQKMAQEFTELVEMKLDITDQVVTLRLTTPRNAPWEGTDYGIKATLEVYVPSDIVVETKTRGFTLDISGPLEEVSVENDFGEITVTDVSGRTNIAGTYNKVELESLRGPVDVETSYNSIRAVDIDTEGGMAAFQTSYAGIEVEDLTGQLRAVTSYAPVRVSGLELVGGRNQIATVHSKIDVGLTGMEKSQLVLTNSFGDVNLQVPEDLSAQLIFTVGSGGKIETDGILITPQVLQKTRLEGICGRGDSEIEADVQGIGRILLEGK